jgi:dTDP-4-amino-4,6-dideoxygalactose transaminase
MTIRYGGVIAGQEEIDAVTEVLKGQQWSAGQVTERFERKFADYVGTDYAVATNSGSSALLLALAACVEPYRRVVIPALQFPTLYSACVWSRHDSNVVDIDPHTLNLSPERLEQWLNEGNRADIVFFVHVAGNPAGVDRIAEICKRYDMLLFEDCCEALGSTLNGKQAGSFGDIAAFSTHSAHHISTGEGGMLLTSNQEFASRVRQYRDWGRDVSHGYDKYQFIHTGFNLRPTDIGSALGLVQMDRLDKFNQARRHNHDYLADMFTEYGLGFDFPDKTPGTDPAWYTFPLLTNKRNTLEEAYREAGVETRRLLCGNLTRQPIASHKGVPERFTAAEDAWKRGMWIPVHPSVTQDDLDLMLEVAVETLHG